MVAMRRAIAILTCVLIVIACSRTSEIPRERFEAASHEGADEYRINTRQGRTYIAQQYAVTDSSLQISTLMPSEFSDQLMPAALSIPLEDVVTIQKVDHGPPVYLMAAVGVVLFVAVAAFISGGDAFTD